MNRYRIQGMEVQTLRMSRKIQFRMISHQTKNWPKQPSHFESELFYTSQEYSQGLRLIYTAERLPYILNITAAKHPF